MKTVMFSHPLQLGYCSELANDMAGHVMCSSEIFSDIHGTDHTIPAYNAHSSKGLSSLFPPGNGDGQGV